MLVLRFGLFVVALFFCNTSTGRAQEQVDTSAAVVVMDTGAVSPADSLLQARLRGAFGEVEAFRGIEVTVRHGVAHLQGTVVQPQEAAAAEALARRFNGVLYVHSTLTAESALADRVVPAVDRLRNYATGALNFLPVGVLALVVLL
jgi:hypothetical protein